MSIIGYISPYSLSGFSCYFMGEITDFPTVVQVFFFSLPLRARACLTRELRKEAASMTLKEGARMWG